ncbi:MAG TPA: EamA family transporter [Trinickia sp.]|nr:EamA family transporter [Trinickia sp.]
MQSAVIALVLVSALLHASWNVHLSGDRVSVLGTMSVPYLVVGALGAALLPLPAPASWPFIGASAVLEFAYCLALIRAYRSGEFGQIYPIARGLSPLVVALLALAFAGEALHPLAAAGIALVSFGIMSLALKRNLRFSGESVPYALLTGLLIACYSVVDGLGVRASGNAFSYLAWVYLIWNVPQILLVRRLRGSLRGLFASRVQAAKGMLAGTLALSAYMLVAFAYRWLPIAMVSALRELSSIFAVLIGWLFLREKLTTQRIAACALVTLGAVLIRL